MREDSIGRGEVWGGGEGRPWGCGWGPVANFLCYGGGQLGGSWSPGFQKQLLRQLLRKQHTRGGSFSQKIESANPTQLS